MIVCKKTFDSMSNGNFPNMGMNMDISKMPNISMINLFGSYRWFSWESQTARK